MGEKLLTPEQAAEYLQVAMSTMYRWLNSGVVRGVKIGNLWRVRQSDLDEYMSRGGTKKEEGEQ